MKHLTNNRDVNILIWETEVKKRKKPQLFTFVAPENSVIEVGDKVLGSLVAETKQSTYTILEIKEVRTASVKGKKHYTTEASWGMELIPQN
jgi:hypothetical protein